jgi:aspartate-semialdehyde dehydrogenase
VRKILAAFPGIVVLDDPGKFEYPMPLIHAQNSDDVFVGRIRMDETQPNTINCWIVSDNLRKGAATNAVQIAESLVKNGMLKVHHEAVS